METDVEKAILDIVNSLNPEQQQEVLDFIDTLILDSEITPIKSVEE